ncbi:hypothetical protein AJ80_03848 [Polytolypa hystricis UAMH7299]|uniref:FAD-binding PCMH-type domain-containing protein n=1 Tax=Polytolypa hystricis (strain UAMH7299) TaxID=1447883 RepID=A0A2B7YF79_POLH7|nr:hypothetical protein AJ80_03848 [Polytolypa hystricis UAMH7299]
MRPFFFLTGALLALPGTIFGASGRGHCRCTPEKPCWPSTTKWRALNDSIDGNLLSLKPVGYVCHNPTYDEEACSNLMKMNDNSLWKSGEPGAVLSPNWEIWPERNESCFAESPRNAPCGQGRIPIYSTIVRTPFHIQRAVRFADKHNLRLVIRNTGHDYLGRSAAPESLQIFTHHMKDMDFTDDFVPDGKKDGKGVGEAVTIGAGVQLAELYRAANKLGKTQVIGLAVSVGAAGGYIQGGGHSPLGPWKGSSIDHVLEYKLVTAKGKLVTANEYQNQDLFWALRGGGGGTFGVVYSVTLRTFKDPPTVFSALNITTGGTAGESYWNAVEKFHSYLPSISDAGGSGYYYIIPDLDFEGQKVSVVAGIFYFVGRDDKESVDKVFEPILSDIESLPGVYVPYDSFQAPSSFATFQLDGEAADEAAGGADPSILGSRLYSEKLLRSKNGPGRLAKAISQLDYSDGTIAIGHLVAGGQVSKNRHVDAALNPSWRDALTHIAVSRKWTLSSGPAGLRQVQKKVTNEDVPILAAVEPHMGAYVNEADVNEPQFQRTFWGSNYPRLLRIKRKWDPEGLFFVKSGVGSEGWDEQGLCRR